MSEEIKTFLDELTEEQRKEVLELIFYTVTEMREEVARKIENTAADWKIQGRVKSRNTLRAFKESADIARGIGY